MKEWFTAADLAARALPGLPATDRGVQSLAQREAWGDRKNMAGGALARKRAGRGGGVEYHYTLLPAAAQAKIMIDLAPEKAKKSAARDETSTAAAWAFYESLPDARKEKTIARLAIIEEVNGLYRGGLTKNLAVVTVGKRHGVTPATIYNWFGLIAGVARADWLPALAPRHTGRTKTAACDEAAWEMVKSDYLRAERPTFESCYRRLKSAAAAHGWAVPSSRALERRMEREIAAPVKILARRGVDTLKAMYPAQQRDRSVFHALEAVNADGHKWDVWVKWPDEDKPMRPMMVAIQDLYSGMFLGWRIDKSENRESVRLAIGDVVEVYGIPGHIYLDNGRGFAAKWLTGGIPNRYRFKVKDEEPVGILTQLGVEVHWTNPYSGQSKPIERAFRDFCNDIAKHPAFAGAWTGNTPLNKPENYGSKAIPIDDFVRVVAEGIDEHNTRTGRRATVCNGRSFVQTFAPSYVTAPIKKATEEQKRLWLLAAEGITAARRDGGLTLMGNRYWGDFLHGHRGQKLVVRFDPDNLHDGLHVYRLDGSYLGFADVIEDTGFNDAAAARDHGRTRRAFIKNTKVLLDQHVKLTGREIAAGLPTPENLPPLESKVVRMAAQPGYEPLMKRPNGPEPVTLSPDEEAEAARIIAEMNGEDAPGAEIVALPVSPGQRPDFKTDEDYAHWVLDNPELADEADRARVGELMNNPSFRLLMGAEAQEKSRHA
ncbi:transposase domain-containing protein [Varunaivibrio sulfuroxidans]|uniref:Mu DNA-binding protein n=1 Tax=Varunaivibrio sulfuroxidans TaxID=1773489 RepID=A0A4R3JAH6_9PROT|nr:transposase domain-containing protein [Varunaivibrio sulfuroxidans]TCS62557.1 Mu DNA-binding protein [Varunaivibrio sulfuroxidans]WES30773.1 transposase domain-containing protein [Varunaivibrio sulfuroxidans]